MLLEGTAPDERMDLETAFYEQVRVCVDEFLAQMPVAATYLGDHRFDDRLPDVSAAGLEVRRRWVQRWLAAFEAQDPAALPADARIDRRVMLHVVERVGRQLDRLRTESSDPLLSLELGVFGIILILQRDYAPLPERLANVAARLQALPAYLGDLRQVMVPAEVAPCWIQPAVFTARTWATILRQGWRAFTGSLPALEEAAERAAAALDGYADWIEQEVAPKGRSIPAVGRGLYEEILHRHHLIDAGSESLCRELRERFEDLDRRFLALPADEEAAAGAGGSDVEHLVEAYRDQVAAAREWVIAERIATIPPGERLAVEPLHPLLRPMLTANAELIEYYIGPLRDAVFTVTPADPDNERQRARLACKHTLAFITLNAALETYPGKRLRLAAASCRRNALPRQLGHYLSPGGYYGWAVYAEELAAENGPLSVRRLHLERQRQRCARAYVDVAVHTGAMDPAQACAFLAERAGLPSAEEDLLLILREPGDWQAHFTGYLEIKRLVAGLLARRPDLDRRQVHDAILAEGAIPPALLAEILPEKLSSSIGEQRASQLR